MDRLELEGREELEAGVDAEAEVEVDRDSLSFFALSITSFSQRSSSMTVLYMS